ncbi:MAG TPA: tetratricopeptide repeat protein [Opitutaceae bacterium]|nr:tetratricopeptide repeat protein [Opitutaceae bacterium]
MTSARLTLRPASSGLGLALLAAAVSTLAFAPSWVLWRGLDVPAALHDPAVNRAADALRQLAHPFAFDAAPNNRVIEWRLFFPLLGRALFLGPRAYLALPHLGCIAALAFAACLLIYRGVGRAETLAAAVLLATCSWFFVSTGWLAYFDSWLMLGLLAAAFAPRKAAIAAILIAPWIDERFVFALPLVLVLRDRYRELFEGPQPPAARRAEARICAAALLPWLLIRLEAHVSGHDPVTRAYLHAMHPNTRPWFYLLGLWEGLRWAWIPVLAWLGLEWREGGGRAAAWRAFVLGAVLAGSLFMADDLSRSVSVAAPAAVLGLLWLHRRRRSILFLAALLALLNLACGAEHVVTGWTEPIRTFPIERDLARHPPPALDPAAYTEQAGLLNGRRDYAGALGQLDLALRIDPDYAPAHSNRAFSLYELGRREEARAEADRTVALDPHFAAGWFNRGLMREAAGDSAGALDDLERALREAPADWPQRRQAEAVAARLRGRGAP